MATQNWVNLASGDGLLYDGHYLDQSARSGDNHFGTIAQAITQPSIAKFSLKITFLKLSSKSPKAKCVNIVAYMRDNDMYMPLCNHVIHVIYVIRFKIERQGMKAVLAQTMDE